MTKPYTVTRRFLFELVSVISLDRNYWKAINLLFVSPILFHLNVLKMLQFWNERLRIKNSLGQRRWNDRTKITTDQINYSNEITRRSSDDRGTREVQSKSGEWRRADTVLRSLMQYYSAKGWAKKEKQGGSVSRQGASGHTGRATSGRCETEIDGCQVVGEIKKSPLSPTVGVAWLIKACDNKRQEGLPCLEGEKGRGWTRKNQEA